MKTCLFLFVVMTVAVSLPAADVSTNALPAPPWAVEQRAPTNNAEIMAYILTVMPYLEDATLFALENAYATHAPTGHILSIVYHDNLHKRLIDYANMGAYVDEEDVPTALEELQEYLRTFAGQWDAIYDSTLWSDDPDNPFSIAGMLQSIQLLEELKERYETPDDPLDNLDEYSSLFTLPGAPMTLYWWMEHEVRRAHTNRAENLMSFLLRPENPNGFTVGSTYYWRGKTYDDWYRQYTNAFTAYLRVHRHPACLVYISHAYFAAAHILTEWRLPRHALALLAIDIPSIGLSEMKSFKHITAADVCFNMRDLPEAMRHLQAAVQTDTEHRRAEIIEWNYNRCPDPGKAQELWERAATQPWGPDDVENAICDALLCERQPPAKELFTDALLHDWPRPEEVPLAVATNRVLNNNVFEYKVRDISLTPTND